MMDEHSKSIQNKTKQKKKKQSFWWRDEMRMDEGFCGVWQLFYFILLQKFVFNYGKHRTMTLVINWEYCIIYFLSLSIFFITQKWQKKLLEKNNFNLKKMYSNFFFKTIVK